MFYSSQFEQNWIHNQVAVAEYLDSLSELSARLDSLQSFADLCHKQSVKSSLDLLCQDKEQPIKLILTLG